MKRYCNILFFFFSLLFVGNKVECRAPDNSVVLHNGSFFIGIVHANPGSNMNEKRPHNEYSVIIFRNGIEGKSLLFSYKADVQPFHLVEYHAGVTKINSARIKYALSFSHFLPPPPESILSFVFRGPPAIC